MDNKESLITEKYITITMEEYKELLIIKGKYEELKEVQNPLIFYDRINNPIMESPYKITCDCNKEGE